MIVEVRKPFFLHIQSAKADELKGFQPEIDRWVLETADAEMPNCIRWADGTIGAMFSTELAALLFKMRWL